ncbi:hypothetical protein [Carboxylicivirga sp. RSCT41]|uniref:hypothetical protein n=1 Tax=Carboxylicivirga agarovorans TaxID=3417570 RepID=UPI003D32A8C3
MQIEDILPEVWLEKNKKHKNDQEIKKIESVINNLLPWHKLHLDFIVNSNSNQHFYSKLLKLLEDSGKDHYSVYFHYNPIPYEVSSLIVSIITFFKVGTKDEIYQICSKLDSNNKFWFNDRIRLLRAANRLPHLFFIKHEVEAKIFQFIKDNNNEGSTEIADRYLSLARAIIVTSVDDASVYFEEAVNITLKFGDELVQRWEAIAALADHTSKAGNTEGHIAYDFIRTAEVVGEYVAREKYWNRNEAVQICGKLNPNIAISALSRWRERDIGWFDGQLFYLIIDLVESGTISPEQGWTFTPFFKDHDIVKLASICINKSNIQSTKDCILKDSVFNLENEGAENTRWRKLRELAAHNNLFNQTLIKNTDLIPESSEEEEPALFIENNRTNNKRHWDDIFNNLDLTCPYHLKKAVKRFDDSYNEGKLNLSNSFWKEATIRVPENDIYKFIENIISSESIDYYELTKFFSVLPTEWTRKVSYKRKLPSLLLKIGCSYATNLANSYSLNRFLKEAKVDKTNKLKLLEGIINGLANYGDINDPNLLFGFIETSTALLNPEESYEVLKYSLERVKLHIDDSFGDGIWNRSLFVDNDLDKNIAGFIWSSLGSPRANERWCAAHCVRKLSELNCCQIIDSLMNWLISEDAGAFGYKEYPFYHLHAKVYLLIALARISITKPNILKDYKDIIIDLALNKEHLLINIYAAKIIINLSNSFPSLINNENLLEVKKVGKSQFPIEDREHFYKTKSYWHKKGVVNQELEFHFSWDFDHYWFEPLGEVFGISSEQVQELATKVLLTEWNIKTTGGYNNDPRVNLWNRSTRQNDTYHSHGGYPKSDNLDFYYSYHSMMAVAAKLLSKMPIIQRNDWYEDVWKEWLNRHILTRSDDKWLADARGAVPLQRPEWINQNNSESWKSDITEDDFMRILIDKNQEENWINIHGGWHEIDNERTENYYINTALVSQETSDSLLNALSTCKDPYDYKLPYYNEERAEVDFGSFKLKGWIKNCEISKRLDDMDPHANEIYYPPYDISDNLKNMYSLHPCDEGKIWFSKALEKTVLICDIWSSYKAYNEDEPPQKGIKLKASLSFLQILCKRLNCEVIFKVSIKRDITYKYRSDKHEYTKPTYKIFLLSPDGSIRNNKGYYQIR